MVTLTGDDGLGSGIAAIQYTLDGSGTRSYTGRSRSPADGSHTLTYRSVGHDRPGRDDEDAHLHASTRRRRRAKATLSPAPVNGFYRGPTTVTLSGNDFGGSGIALDRVPARLGRLDDVLGAVRGLGRRRALDPVPRDRQRRERGGREVEVVHDRLGGPGDLDHDAVGGRPAGALLGRRADVQLHRRRLGRLVLLGPGDGHDGPGRHAHLHGHGDRQRREHDHADAHLQRLLGGLRLGRDFRASRPARS